MKRLIQPIFLLTTNLLNAQDDTSAAALSFSGYAEVYYAYDFNKPADHNRPSFFYSHNRHNEFNLNLGFVKANYSAERIHANVALAAGTYLNTNYASEPGVLNNVYEANAGFKLSKSKNLWLDGGIFASHIGFESVIYSLNLDYQIRNNAVWRPEGHSLSSKDEIFNDEGVASKMNTFVTTSLAISF